MHHLLRIVLKAYPSRWRQRYGHELEQLSSETLANTPSQIGKLLILADVLYGGVDERAHSAYTERTNAIAVVLGFTPDRGDLGYAAWAS